MMRYSEDTDTPFELHYKDGSTLSQPLQNAINDLENKGVGGQMVKVGSTVLEDVNLSVQITSYFMTRAVSDPSYITAPVGPTQTE